MVTRLTKKPKEDSRTEKARKKIIEIFKDQQYEIIEEKQYPCENNMGEPIIPPYQVDIVVKKEFIIELDPIEIHGSRTKINHDDWRDNNIKREYGVKTVRLIPKDILKQEPEEIMNEINYQLKDKKWLNVVTVKR